MLSLFAILFLPAFAAERAAVGLAADGTVIYSSIHGRTGARILVVGGLDGDPGSAALIEKEASSARKGLAVTAIGLANPAKSTLRFPPEGDAYRENSESHAIWRWILTTGPDLVIIAGADPGGLAGALGNVVPVRSLEAKTGFLKVEPPAKSEIRRELEARAARTPKQVAEQAAKVYGHDLNDAVYIPAFAVIARLRLGEQADVERIVAPYVSGAKDSLTKPSGSHFAGHLIFAELAERTRNPRYVDRVRAAANFGFTESGEMKESMPLHSQMSDAVFMGGPILVKAGKLTGERKYHDMALRHFRFMRKLDLRPDGLWRHSPLDEAAWGRGNAFALLGMALTLADLPLDHEGFKEILSSYQSHAAALLKQQDESGMWRQVIDMPGAYRELSATCMITRALLIGVRKGWLNAREYQPNVNRAWEAVKIRAAPDGKLMDVCESTGAQKSLADYLKRKAIMGADPRGGAMALMLAVEMAGL
jgi:unsaturated rhamnogalacturonyl hydrolase